MLTCKGFYDQLELVRSGQVQKKGVKGENYLEFLF